MFVSLARSVHPLCFAIVFPPFSSLTNFHFMDQLDLFEETYPCKFAVVFCSCIIEDQFEIIWERQELVSSNLSKDAADNLAKQKNSEIYPGKADYYKVVEMEGVNFLVS
jgi:hypothetical protein